MRILFVILRKEFKQFFASGFLPRLCVIFPMMVMLVLPLVANMEVKHVGVAIVDDDHSTFSLDLTTTIAATPNTSVVAHAPTYAMALAMVERGDADVIVEIPSGFCNSLITRYPKSINISANAVNATKGLLGMQYVQVIVARQIMANMPVNARGADISQAGMAPGDMVQSDMAPSDLVQIHSLNLFNPTLNYKFFMIPALMIMLMVMLCGFLPGLNIVGEKERGTIEQINVSPISQLAFAFGKVIPYWIIGLVVLTIGIVIAWAVYGLVPAGSIATLYIATFMFIIVMSSLAMIISNFSDYMQQVMFVMFFFVVVFILMSGLMTPIQSMPQAAQYITYALPSRYYVDIMRATYLRGTTIIEQWQSILPLAVFSLVMMATAILTYRKRS